MTIPKLAGALTALTMCLCAQTACDNQDGGDKETGGAATDTGDPPHTDEAPCDCTDEDACTEEEWEDCVDTGALLLYYGWTSEFVLGEDSAGNDYAIGGEEFYYYNDGYYGDYVCSTVRDGVGAPSVHPCSECVFALDLTMGSSAINDDTNILCDELGITGEDSGFTRSGIGFAYEYGGYEDIMVYYFPSSGTWYPIAYSDFDGETWTYTYAPSAWYTYF